MRRFKKKTKPYRLIKHFILTKGSSSFKAAYEEWKHDDIVPHDVLDYQDRLDLKRAVRYANKLLHDLGIEGEIFYPVGDERLLVSDKLRTCFIRRKSG